MTRVSHRIDRLEIACDDPSLVANAGLLMDASSGRPAVTPARRVLQESGVVEPGGEVARMRSRVKLRHPLAVSYEVSGIAGSFRSGSGPVQQVQQLSGAVSGGADQSTWAGITEHVDAERARCTCSELILVGEVARGGQDRCGRNV